MSKVNWILAIAGVAVALYIRLPGDSASLDLYSKAVRAQGESGVLTNDIYVPIALSRSFCCPGKAAPEPGPTPILGLDTLVGGDYRGCRVVIDHDSNESNMVESTTSIDFDEVGNILQYSLYRRYPDVREDKAQFKYSNGNLVTRLVLRDGVDISDFVQTFEYDDLGRLYRERVDYKIDGVIDGITSYDYSGNTLSRKRFDRNGDGQDDEMVAYEYDIADRVINEKGDNDNDGVTDYTRKTYWGYDVILRDETTIGKNANFARGMRYGYDEYMRLVEKEFISYENTDGDNPRTIYYYDQQSRRIRAEYYVSDILDVLNLWSFDASGRVYEFEIATGSGYHSMARYSYHCGES
jgi:hypothetical protein